MRTRQRNQGFTLIETVVACLLLAVGLAGTWGLINSLVRFNAFSQSVTEAVTYGEEKIEELRIQDFDDVQTGNDQVDHFTRTWTVAPGPLTDTKTVNLLVTWQDMDSRAHRTALTVLLAQR